MANIIAKKSVAQLKRNLEEQVIQKEGTCACLHVTNYFHVVSIDVRIFVISVIASLAK